MNEEDYWFDQYIEDEKYADLLHRQRQDEKKHNRKSLINAGIVIIIAIVLTMALVWLFCS